MPLAPETKGTKTHVFERATLREPFHLVWCPCLGCTPYFLGRMCRILEMA